MTEKKSHPGCRERKEGSRILLGEPTKKPIIYEREGGGEGKLERNFSES